MAFIVIAVVWAVSLLLPAIDIADGRMLRGWEILFRGWQGLRFGLVAWVANPLIVLCILGYASGFVRVGLVVSGAALVVAMTSFAAAAIAVKAGLPLGEIRFDVGFFVWLGAIAALFVWHLVELAMRRQRPSDELARRERD